MLPWNKQQKNVKKSEIEEIIKRLASIYLKLTVHESEDSYYHRGKEDEERITLLLKDIEILRRNVSDFIARKDSKIVVSWIIS